MTIKRSDANAAIMLLAELYPACFAVYEARRRPLKVGIRDDIIAKVNGAVKQSSRTSNVVFPPAFLVAYVSRMMTLMPGDLILTGTPAGVGPIKSGDKVVAEISGVGKLSVTVR